MNDEKPTMAEAIGKKMDEVVDLSASLTAPLSVHARALCCHCECLAFNAANMLAVIRDEAPPYDEADYTRALQKWGLVGDNGCPTFND